MVMAGNTAIIIRNATMAVVGTSRAASTATSTATTQHDKDTFSEVEGLRPGNRLLQHATLSHSNDPNKSYDSWVRVKRQRRGCWP